MKARQPEFVQNVVYTVLLSNITCVHQKTSTQKEYSSYNMASGLYVVGQNIFQVVKVVII